MAPPVVIIPLAFPTFDNTVITFDTINFTFDGACLINGGATQLPRRQRPNGPLSTDASIP
jgi:hypothetical protein